MSAKGGRVPGSPALAAAARLSSSRRRIVASTSLSHSCSAAAISCGVRGAVSVPQAQAREATSVQTRAPGPPWRGTSPAGGPPTSQSSPAGGAPCIAAWAPQTGAPPASWTSPLDTGACAYSRRGWAPAPTLPQRGGSARNRSAAPPHNGHSTSARRPNLRASQRLSRGDSHVSSVAAQGRPPGLRRGRGPQGVSVLATSSGPVVRPAAPP